MKVLFVAGPIDGLVLSGDPNMKWVSMEDDTGTYRYTRRDLSHTIKDSKLVFYAPWAMGDQEAMEAFELRWAML